MGGSPPPPSPPARPRAGGRENRRDSVKVTVVNRALRASLPGSAFNRSLIGRISHWDTLRVINIDVLQRCTTLWRIIEEDEYYYPFPPPLLLTYPLLDHSRLFFFPPYLYRLRT